MNAPKFPVSEVIEYRRSGCVTFDYRSLVESNWMPFEICLQLNSAGLPVSLGVGNLVFWRDPEWRWERFREAAAKVGATWWSCERSEGGRSLTFRWGV